MSSSGRNLNILVSTNAVDLESVSSSAASHATDLYANLPPLAHGWAKVRKLFRFNPADALTMKDIPPGLYSYVQQKEAPHTITLMYTTTYKSLHSKQAAYLNLPSTPECLLSGGEMVIGAYGQTVAWSFRTGYFAGMLGLVNPPLDGQLLKDVGLPVDCFYDAVFWTEFQDTHGYFAEFFNTDGRSKIINKTPKLILDNAAENERIQKLREARNEDEASRVSRFSGETLKLYSTLQVARNQYELMAPKPTEQRPLVARRGGARAASQRNASIDFVGTSAAASLIQPISPAKDKPGTDPARLRTLSIDVDHTDTMGQSLPGMLGPFSTPGIRGDIPAKTQCALIGGDSSSVMTSSSVGGVSGYRAFDKLKTLEASSSLVLPSSKALSPKSHHPVGSDQQKTWARMFAMPREQSEPIPRKMDVSDPAYANATELTAYHGRVRSLEREDSLSILPEADDEYVRSMSRPQFFIRERVEVVPTTVRTQEDERGSSCCFSFRAIFGVK